MSGIQSNVGLITGIPIQDTVDQLLAISARPRDLLVSRNQESVAEKTAVDRLSSLVLALQFSATNLNRTATYTARTATSSNANALTATVAAGASPKAGSYQLTPLRTASAHNLVSSSFKDLSSAIGDGELNFRFGGHVDKGIALSELNGGAGFNTGKIKITDRSGSTGVIDLRAAVTVDDVISAINESEEISVTASASGDRLVLTDNTGESGNFRVQEVGGGTTASTLGLAGLNAAADTLTGSDIFSLHSGTQLSTLNDGRGVYVTNSSDELEIDDLVFTLADETTAGVDLSGATTLGDVIDAINNDADLSEKVTASISADGNRLEITDLTTGAGEFTISNNSVLGTAADDLGLTGAAVGGAITGERLVSGLKDTLVSSLKGGQGVELGSIDVTDRSGASEVIDLSSAETLGEIVDLLNASAVGITASINSSRNGIKITDTSGGTGNLIIAEDGAGTTAETLGLLIDDAVGSVNSGSLDRQVASYGTLLSSLNGGEGIDLDDFQITDSNGKKIQVDLDTKTDDTEFTTLGDVIDKINNASLSAGSGVVASINEKGDGILLTDTGSGSGTLTVIERGGTTAADLKLLGASTTTNDLGQQIINGATSYSVDLTDLEQSAEGISLSSLNGGSGVDLGIFKITDSANVTKSINLGKAGDEAFTIGDVIDKINAAGLGVTAAVNEAGTGIELTDTAGGSGKLTVEDLGTDTAAADLNLIGESSSTNDLDQQVINGKGLFAATDAEQSALDTLAERINDLSAGVSASVVFDGVGYRLSISADKTGSSSEILLDASSTGLSFQETSRAQDAAALVGPSSGGFVVTSENNSFNDIVDGLNLSVKQATGEAVTVNVTSNVTPLTNAVKSFVDAYNALRTEIDGVTNFDEAAQTTGILFGRNEVLRVETELASVVSGSFLFSGDLRSLESVGIRLDDKGKLSVDNAALTAAFNEDPSAVQKLFTDKDTGVVAKLRAATGRLASDGNSLLSERSKALQAKIDDFGERIETWDARLERQRDSLLLQFFRLEETIANLQSNTSLLDSIQFISFQSRSSSSSS